MSVLATLAAAGGLGSVQAQDAAATADEWKPARPARRTWDESAEPPVRTKAEPLAKSAVAQPVMDEAIAAEPIMRTNYTTDHLYDPPGPDRYRRMTHERPVEPMAQRPVYTSRSQQRLAEAPGNYRSRLTARRMMRDQQEGVLPEGEALPTPPRGEVIGPGQRGERVYESYEGEGEGDVLYEEGDYFGPGHGDCCDDDCCYDYGCCDWHWLQDFTVSSGIHGFKGPHDGFDPNGDDQSRNGDFGYHVGINWGGPLFHEICIGYQVGWGVARSNFEGDEEHGPGADRTQHFITAGLFHRAECGGLQGGVVFDWLDDDSYADLTLAQLRAELGFVGPHGKEFGFAGAFAVGQEGEDLDTDGGVFNVDFEPLDYYSFYVRKRFTYGGEGRLFAGATSEGQGVLGGDFLSPIGPCFAVQADWLYATAEDRGEDSSDDEVWSISLNLVWYPHCTATCATQSKYRPLFNTANNSTFIIDRPDQGSFTD